MVLYTNKAIVLTHKWNLTGNRKFLLHILQKRWSYTSIHLQAACPNLLSTHSIKNSSSNEKVSLQQNMEYFYDEYIWIPAKKKTTHRQLNIGNYQLLYLPCDMGTQVLPLTTIPSTSRVNGNSSLLLGNDISPIKNNDALIDLAKIAYQMLNNGENIKKNYDQHTSANPHRWNSTEHRKCSNKDIEPADDPKQKIRNLHTKLRKQLPAFLSKGSAWHDFNIYTPSIELMITTPRRYNNKFVFRGISSYKRVAQCFRYICRFCLRSPRLEVLHMTSFEEKKTIEVRWRVVGSPFYYRIFSILLPPSLAAKFIKYYDYMSILYVNDSGKVWRHDVSKMRRVSQSLATWLPAIRKRLHAASPAAMSTSSNGNT